MEKFCLLFILFRFLNLKGHKLLVFLALFVEVIQIKCRDDIFFFEKKLLDLSVYDGRDPTQLLTILQYRLCKNTLIKCISMEFSDSILDKANIL